MLTCMSNIEHGSKLGGMESLHHLYTVVESYQRAKAIEKYQRTEKQLACSSSSQPNKGLFCEGAGSTGDVGRFYCDQSGATQCTIGGQPNNKEKLVIKHFK
eukprot:TRINITY_DN10571_c0_g3_i2.p1 TRINITY_DN10571_c0_g3~~TRINITY_DN10571_c0_g3_i2.p1  ORF type:complete len:101 (-),score=6.57 TRINITY_DN10571_c0_g3_i2:89-391(-)